MRQVQGEQDEVPKEVLGGGDFVEGDEGVGLEEEGAWDCRSLRGVGGLGGDAGFGSCRGASVA